MIENDDNPYAPPAIIPDETLTPEYDIYKIAKYHNRIRFVFRWFFLLLVLELVSFFTVLSFAQTSQDSSLNMITYVIIFSIYLSGNFVITALFAIGLFGGIKMLLLLKYRLPAFFLMTFGLLQCGLNILIYWLLLRRAKKILEEHDVKIGPRRIDLTTIPRDQLEF